MRSPPRLSLVFVVLTVFAVAGVVAWSSCSAPRPRFTSDAELREALLGKSADEVRALLGEPDVTGIGGPLDSVVWSYQEPRIKTAKSGPIYLHFDKEDKVRYVGSLRP
jgi:hypothetical protein